MWLSEDMQPSFLHTPFGEVAFRRFGSGPRLLIAFHGFSDDGAVFSELGEALKGCCTILAVDLPFHGDTWWRRDDYQPAQLAAVVEAVLEQEDNKQFEAIGHSLGARLWLHLPPHFQNRMKSLYLLAPDGLQTRWLYLVEWLPPRFRRLTARLARRPERLLALIRILYRIRLIDHFLFRYLQHHLSDKQRRQRLLHTWFSLSYFRLGRKQVGRLLGQVKAPVLVLLGSKDRLVSPAAIRRRLKGIEGIMIREVEANHRSICRAVAPILKEGPGNENIKNGYAPET